MATLLALAGKCVRYVVSQVASAPVCCTQILSLRHDCCASLSFSSLGPSKGKRESESKRQLNFLSIRKQKIFTLFHIAVFFLFPTELFFLLRF